MKTCTNCNKEKSLDCFSKKQRAKDGLQHTCKLCKSIYVKEHYNNNKDYYKKKARVSDKLNNKLQFMVDYLKVHPCVDCGETDPIVLQFDHVKTKKYNVSQMTHMSITKIEKEIEQCEIRCGNCHIRKTAKQFGWYKSIKL